MRLQDSRTFLAAAAALALTGCSLGDEGLSELPPASQAPPPGAPVYGTPVSDTPVLIGEPYQLNGITYTPADTGRYDEVGLASYYGNELAGRPTANGERFNPTGISAAHRTLPLPSYVEVTSLETGRTILVRINDRGPFEPDRVIDLSIGAARQLGIVERGVAPVRVRRVEPIEADKARLRAGQSAQERLGASPQLLAALRAQFERGGGVVPDAAPPSDAAGTAAAAPSGNGVGVTWQDPGAASAPPPRNPQPAPVAARGSHFVQLGAFSNAANARRVASRASSLGNVTISRSGNISRVRLGPYPSEAAANAALSRARGAGFGDARVFRDSGR